MSNETVIPMRLVFEVRDDTVHALLESRAGATTGERIWLASVKSALLERSATFGERWRVLLAEAIRDHMNYLFKEEIKDVKIKI